MALQCVNGLDVRVLVGRHVPVEPVGQDIHGTGDAVCASQPLVQRGVRGRLRCGADAAD
jgi:hypothetical protein